MKKSLLVIPAVLAATQLALAPVVHAEEGGEYKSNGEVEFTQDTSITPPVHPVEPEENVDPKDPPQLGTEGPLSIDFASNFNFGANIISTNDETYYSSMQELKDGRIVPNYVQVTDKRGTFAGWTLRLKQEGQFKARRSATENHVLDGAQISYKNVALASKTDSKYKPGMIKEQHDLVPGADQVIMEAREDQGMGTWVYRFGTDDKEAKKAISLTVPGGTTKLAAKYETELVWTLVAAPTAGGEEGGE